MWLVLLALLCGSVPAWGQQFARPDADTVFNWEGGETVDTAGNRYQNIDETSASDSDYVWCGNNPADDTYEISLSDVDDPTSSSGHILRIRYCQIDSNESGSPPHTCDATGTATSLAWELREVTTIIAQGTAQAPDGAWHTGPETAGAYTLTGAEADNIGNYNNLNVLVTANGGGGSPANRRCVGISWVELQVPTTTTSGGGRRLLTEGEERYHARDVRAEAERLVAR